MSSRRVVVPLLVGALLPWGIGPAAAEDLTQVDVRGDMWAVSEGGAVVPSPDTSQGDVTRARVSYRGNRVVVLLRFVDLAKRGAYAQYALLLEGKDRRTREVVVEAGPKHWAGRVLVFKPHGDLVDDCPVARHIDYAAETVRVRVKRTCLARPRSVGANVNVDLVDDDGVFRSDNPHDALDHSDAWTAWVRRST
ncbi:MAG: hypothetical protein ACXWW7_13115 [Nocardioides sp.]